MFDKNRKPPVIRATVDRKRLFTALCGVAVMAVVMGTALLPKAEKQESAVPPVVHEAAVDSALTLSEDCQIIQKLTFTPCGHELIRRQVLPPELHGKTRSELEKAYDLWRITAFAPAQVEMEQALSLFCPEHAVLMPDDSGQLCIFRNRYGDALALVRELGVPLSDLPDEIQEQLRPGKGFDSESDLEQWLESVLS